jgi:hypothetical protein
MILSWDGPCELHRPSGYNRALPDKAIQEVLSLHILGQGLF